MVTSTGKPITHSALLRDLLQAVLLPAQIAVCKCAAHISNTDNVFNGNRLADVTAKAAAQGDYGKTDIYASASDENNTLIDQTILKDMQVAATRSEKHLWLSKGATLYNNQLYVVHNKPVLPRSLFRAAALMTHRPCHVSTGGMVRQLQRIFTTFGIEPYLKDFCKSCVTCIRHNSQGNMTPK